MDVKFLIQGTLSLSKDDLWPIVHSHVDVYHCQWCLSVRDREKEIETGDGQMNRIREGELSTKFWQVCCVPPWTLFTLSGLIRP